MTDRNDPYKVSLDVQVGQGGDEPRALPQMPFNVGVIGDFSGREGAHGPGSGGLADRVPVLVDPDNVLRLAGLEPELRITLDEDADATLSIRFRELEDFHPDRLLDALPLAGSLMETRARLADPGTFRQAMSELEETIAPDDGPTDHAAPGEPGPTERRAGLLDAIVEETAVETPSPWDTVRTGLDRYVRGIVRPHLVPGQDPRQMEMIAGVDAALGELVRRVLHHPEFQRLEGAWRAVFSLVSRALAVSDRIRVYLVDVSRSEMDADLRGNGDVRRTALFRVLAGEAGGAPDGSPWSVLLGFDPVGSGAQDVGLMSRIAELSSVFGVCWLSGARRSTAAPVPTDDGATLLDGAWSTPEWDTFRATPTARSLGLSTPRVLLRLPYGADSEPCERFRFEEVSDTWAQGDYLWGDSTHLCALALASMAYGRGGAGAGRPAEFDGFPLHVREGRGGTVMQPCAEAVLDDEAVAALLARGFMPIQAARGQDLARVPVLQSVAAPRAPLALWWVGRGVFG